MSLGEGKCNTPIKFYCAQDAFPMFSEVSRPPAKQLRRRASESDWAVRNWSAAKGDSFVTRFVDFTVHRPPHLAYKKLVLL